MSHAPSLLALGFLLGLRHALDPDHVVAVSAIVARHPSLWRAAQVGALWGVGHALTVLAVGGVIAWFRVAMADSVARALEFGVALMLIGIGLSNLREPGDRARHAARPALVGMVHGLAGSAAVALLVLATVTDVRLALAYLAVFGLGTVVAMTSVTAFLAWPLRAASDRFPGARRRLMVGSGLASIAVGVWLAWTLVSEHRITG